MWEREDHELSSMEFESYNEFCEEFSYKVLVRVKRMNPLYIVCWHIAMLVRKFSYIKNSPLWLLSTE